MRTLRTMTSVLRAFVFMLVPCVSFSQKDKTSLKAAAGFWFGLLISKRYLHTTITLHTAYRVPGCPPPLLPLTPPLVNKPTQNPGRSSIASALKLHFRALTSILPNILLPVPSKPQDLRAWNTSAFTIFVTWKKPANINGILKGYQVTC